ncbi:angiotensinogen [Aquarana catesbeiana]|uniref:angiotensinogen n=1 Tax=Aquarana catesbeiana TaxID=8400 RepID=UPI003CC969D2
MYIQNILLCLIASLVLSTCNRVYVHPFNLFAYNKSECEHIQTQNDTIEKTFLPISIETEITSEEKIWKVKTYPRKYNFGYLESFVTSLINDLGLRAFEALKGIHTSNTILLPSTNFYCSMVSFYLGASGETAMSLQKLLGFEHPSGSTSCTSQVNGLKIISKLKTIDSALFSKNDSISVWKTVSIFVSPGVPLSENFIHDLGPSADHLYTRAVNFTNSATAVHLINEFLDARLPKKTKSGLTPFDEASNVMYISHVYYKGKVTKSFLIPELQQFWIEPNRQISVPMISASGIFQFKDDSIKNQLVLKIYLGENDFLLLILPTNGNTIENIESSITSYNWQTLNWLNGLSNRYIHLTIPKLEIECSYDAKDLLTYMKLSSLLQKTAHFGKLSNEQINIGKILNIVHFELEDSGENEANYIPEKNKGQEPLEVNVNKPFILVFFEGTTKALILLGRIVNPLNII